MGVVNDHGGSRVITFTIVVLHKVYHQGVTDLFHTNNLIKTIRVATGDTVYNFGIVLNRVSGTGQVVNIKATGQKRNVEFGNSIVLIMADNKQ